MNERHENDYIKGGWNFFAHVDKYSEAQTQRVAREFGVADPLSRHFNEVLGEEAPADGVAESAGNLLTTVGLQRITNLIIGAAGGAFNVTQAVVAVGDTSTAALIGDVDLGAITGSTHRCMQLADSVPTAVNGVITAVATFTTGNANFAWNEFGWVVSTGTVTSPSTVLIDATHPGSTGNVLLNHKIASLGTKASGSWVFTSTVTIA